MSSLSIYILGLRESFRGEALLTNLKKSFPNIYVYWGIDARERPIDPVFRNDSRSIRIYGRALRDAEIACTIGHFEILKLAHKNPTDITLILEDDAEVIDVNFLHTWLHELELLTPKIWTFASPSSSKLVLPSPNKNSSKKTFCIPTLAHAYAINQLALNLALEGYAHYGFEGFQADYPLFYSDFATFLIAPKNVIQQGSVESLIGDRLVRSNIKIRLGIIRSTLILTCALWFMSGHRDSKIRGFLQFYHARKLHGYLVYLQNIFRFSSRSPT
jgi:hypothetical protein